MVLATTGTLTFIAFGCEGVFQTARSTRPATDRYRQYGFRSGALQMHLDEVAESVKQGIWAAAAFPDNLPVSRWVRPR